MAFDKELLRMKGTIIARTILEHSCWVCWIPYLNCKEISELDKRLTAVRSRLDRIAKLEGK